MSYTSYEIVKYSPEFKSGIIELQKHLWSPDAAVNAAYLEWKYEQNPYIDTPLISLALCEGRAVGMRGLFGAKWQIGNPGQTLLCPCSVDSLVAPGHRGHGLSKRLRTAHLNELFESGYSYNFVLSANPISYANLMKMGWRSIGSIQRMWREARQGINASRVLSYLAKLSLIRSTGAKNPFYFLDDGAAERRGKVSPHVSVEQTPRPEAMAELVERIDYDGRIRHVRDREFFSWRFNNPLSRYRFLFWEEARLEGYLVLQTKFNDDTLRVRIVDWEAANLQARSDLLEVALGLGNFNSLSIWTAALPDEVKMLLERNGFKILSEAKSITQHRTTVLVRPVSNDMVNTDWTIDNRRLLDLPNWDLRMIYSDAN